MNRINRLAYRILTAPARFEAWIEAADEQPFFAFCDAMTPLIAVTVFCGLFGLCLAGTIIHCLK